MLAHSILLLLLLLFFIGPWFYQGTYKIKKESMKKRNDAAGLQEGRRRKYVR